MIFDLIKSSINCGRGGVGALSLLVASTLFFPGCSPNVISASGPSLGRIKSETAGNANRNIKFVRVTEAVTRRLRENSERHLFSQTFGKASVADSFVGPGDTLLISIWEAPPATLFGVGGNAASFPQGGSRPSELPELMVDNAGTISVPFAGTIRVSGRTPQQVAVEIVRRLRGKAHEPQVLVRAARNGTSTVTIVGDVANSQRLALTARGERLLDALAAAGGVRQAVGKTSIRITRDDIVQTLPLETVINDHQQNIVLEAGDVVTALYLPLSFTVLGATGRNEEINFESQGISLAQALGRGGGLQDQRADARGVFVFRFEEPGALEPGLDGKLPLTMDGKVPVIYQIDLKDAAGFFSAQNFLIRNKDVVYVSNAPLADLQKFTNLVSSIVLPAATVATVTR